MMKANSTLEFLALEGFSAVNSSKSVMKRRVLYVDITSVSQTAPTANKIQSFFNAATTWGFTYLSITDNCSLEQQNSNSWHMVCRCYRYRLKQHFDCLSLVCTMSLHSVDLSGTNISSNEARMIFVSLQKCDCVIKNLNLSNNYLCFNDEEAKKMGDAAKAMLMAGSKCSLQVLRLSNCAISDIVCKYVADGLRQNKSVLKLDLSENRITSLGAVAIFESLEYNSTLEVLNIANNHNILSSGEKLKCAAEKMFSNITLKVLNVLSSINDNLAEGIANGLMTNKNTMRLEMLHIDIYSLTIKTIVCLLEVLSKWPHVGIQGSKHCFSFQKCSQWHFNCADGLTLFCALHRISNTSLAHLVLKNVQTLDLEGFNIMYKSLFRSLETNKWLKELKLSQSKILQNELTKREASVGVTLKRMLSRNESLVSLNLCNAINDDIADELAAGLREKCTLKILYIDMRFLSHNSVIKLVNSFIHSGLLVVNIESVGILHINNCADNKTNKPLCIIQHHNDSAALQLQGVVQYLQSSRLLWNRNSRIIQIDCRWCMHLEENNLMLLKFYTALSERAHQRSQMILDMLSSIQTVELYGDLMSHDTVKKFLTSLENCPQQKLEQIDIGFDVHLVGQKVSAAFKGLLANNSTLKILTVHSLIDDEVASVIAENLASSFKLTRLDMNIEFLGIQTVAKIIKGVETSRVQELKLIPILHFQRQPNSEHLWHLHRIKSTILQYVCRLHEYCQQSSVFKTLDLSPVHRNVASQEVMSVLKSIETISYKFLEGLILSISNDSDHEHCILGNAIRNILSSKKCHLKLLRLVHSRKSEMIFSEIAVGLSNNKSLTVLNLYCDQINEHDLSQLLLYLKQSSTMREFYLSGSTLVKCKEAPILCMRQAFKQLLESRTLNLKALGFCVNVNCDEMCAGISAGLDGNSKLEKLQINASSVTVSGISSLLSSITSNSHCALNYIVINEMCTLKKASEWNLELTCTAPGLNDLFCLLNSISTLQLKTPVIVSHYKGSLFLPLHAFGTQFPRSFTFKNLNSLTKLSLYQSQHVKRVNKIAIRETLSEIKLENLVLYSPNNMTIVQEVISCIADKVFSLSVLHLDMDLCVLNGSIVLNLLTILKEGTLTELWFTHLRLKCSPNSSMPIFIDNMDSAEFCTLFCILNESMYSCNPMVKSILAFIKKLDFSKVYIDNILCIRFLRCLRGNDSLKDLSLPGIRSIRRPYVVDMGVAIKDALTVNKSLTVLKVCDFSYSTIVCELAVGLAQNTSLKHIYVHPMMILLGDATLMKSTLAHQRLTCLHTESTHLRKDPDNDGQWLLEAGKNSDDRSCYIVMICALAKVCYQDVSSEGSIRRKAMSILQSISALQINFQRLLFGTLTNEFVESVKVSPNLQYLDIHCCCVGDEFLQMIKKTITCSTSLEHLHLHLQASECPVFDGVFNAVRTNTSLKVLSICYSSLVPEAIANLIHEFNKSYKLLCKVHISFSNISIIRENISWSIELRSVESLDCSQSSLSVLFTALDLVQTKERSKSIVNLSFCFSESLQSLNLSAISSKLATSILENLVGHTKLGCLDLTGIKSLVECNSKVAGRAICGLLSPPTSLQILNVLWCSIGDPGCSHIAAGLNLNTSLKILVLIGNQIQGEGMLEILKSLKGNSTLVTLDLSCNEGLASGNGKLLALAIQDMLHTENSSLETLNLNHCGVTDQICIGIASGLDGNTTLKNLTLRNNSFTGIGIIPILENANHLKVLSLSLNKQLAMEEGSNALGSAFESMLNTSTSLNSLDVCGSVNDRIVSRIITALEFKQNLVRLDVNRCPLSAVTVTSLIRSCEYKGFNELKVADVRCNYRFETFYDMYQWQIQGEDSSNCTLFYLLVLSEHGRSTVLGQMAYNKLHPLSRLILNKSNLTSSQFFSVVKTLQYIPNLIELDLSANKLLTDGKLEASTDVCSALNKSLLVRQINALNISCTGIHPKSWKYLFTHLSSASLLEVLDISGNHLGQEGSMALIQMLSHFGGLIKLNIFGCDIPDEFFTSDYINVLATKKLTLKLNCDSHQQLLLESIVTSHYEEFEISNDCSYGWWHKWKL